MPKIIEDARGRILAAVRSHVEHEGRKALALRTIAARSGLGLGTIYNYFSSSEEIGAALIARDFAEAMEGAGQAIEGAQDTREAIETLFAALAAFMRVYRLVWTDAGPSTPGHHDKGVEGSEAGISALLSAILSRRRVVEGLDPDLVLSLATTAFLRLAHHFPGGCEPLFPILDRLFEAETTFPKEK